MTDAAPRLEAYTLSDWPEQLADLVEALVQKLAGGIKRYPAKGCLQYRDSFNSAASYRLQN
jgi:hypothetical protein